MSLVVGTAPDSWGVWYPEHESQPPWPRFLDEAAAAGYRWIELGPFGYLPTEEARLREELESRGLALIAGTLIDDLHFPSERERVMAKADRICRLVAALGGRFLVLIANPYRVSRELAGPTQLDPEQWREFLTTNHEIGRVVRDHGLTLTFHPHADTVVEYAGQVERYLEDTDPDVVKLCLDTGHYEYRDGDSVELFRQRWPRIPYFHLKSVTADAKRMAADGLDFVHAVQLGAMCEPTEGVVDFAGLARAMEEIGYEGWAIVEQDMFPLDDHDRPLPIARRTLEFFQQLGWSSGRQ
jgi:inosose dehydratase